MEESEVDKPAEQLPPPPPPAAAPPEPPAQESSGQEETSKEEEGKNPSLVPSQNGSDKKKSLQEGEGM